MSDALDQRITVTEMAAMDQPIDVTPCTTAAFIGRALRGPLNTPVLIENFAAFRRRFGGIWQRSSLGPSVRQFFDHGGRRLYVVRVANSVRGAMICLPARGGMLVLHAVEPGSTENIRAAVDYDGIDAADTAHFNLTVQRTAPDSGVIVDQEIYRRLSVEEDDHRYIADALLGSSLVRVHLPLPAGRPAATAEAGTGAASGYVGHAQRGSDGVELTDYDLVGSAQHETGLFALDGVDQFDLLYLPPPGRHRDLGPTAILAAELYCRKRGAMLVLDPPAAWTSVDEAVSGVRDAGFASSNILSYFPRMYSRDEEGAPPRAVGGALCGLLCKLDEQQGPWQDLDQHSFAFSRRLTPSLHLTASESAALVREGLNVIAGHGAARSTLCGAVTLARGNHLDRKFSSLTVRRLCLRITGAIERATRWSVFEPNPARVAKSVRGQVHAYMVWLADQGAFADGNFSVQCDADLHVTVSGPQRGVTVLLTFHPADSDELVSLTLHRTVAGFRVAMTAFAPVTAECA